MHTGLNDGIIVSYINRHKKQKNKLKWTFKLYSLQFCATIVRLEYYSNIDKHHLQAKRIMLTILC